MKKISIFYSVFAFAFGASLIALSIYLRSFELAQTIANTLVEKFSILGLIFVLIISVPLLLLRIDFLVCLAWGNIYLVMGITTIFAACKGNLQWLRTRFNVLRYINAMLFALVLFIDVIAVAVVVYNEEIGISAEFIIFTVIITLTSLVLEITSLVAYKKVNQLIQKGLSE